MLYFKYNINPTNQHKAFIKLTSTRIENAK